MPAPQFFVRKRGDVTIAGTDPADGEPLPESVGLGGLVSHGAAKLLIDLTGLTMLSSALLGELLTLDRRARMLDAEVRLCSPDVELGEVFRMTKLDSLLFRVFPTLDAALEGF